MEEFIRVANEYSCKTDLRSLRMAAQNIRELEELAKDNAEIPILIKNVNDALENIQAREIIKNWWNQNQADEYLYVGAAIEQIRAGLFDGIFLNFAENLSYEVLRNIDNSSFQYLTVLFNEARNKISYPTRTTPELIRLVNRLKEISLSQGTK